MGSQVITFPCLSVTTVRDELDMNHYTSSCLPMAKRIRLIKCRYISPSVLYFSAIILGKSSSGIGDIEGSLVVIRNTVSSTHRSLE